MSFEMYTDIPNPINYPDLRGTSRFFMWSDAHNQWVSREMKNIKCDECGCKYDSEWYTDDLGRDGEMLTCGDCGQQFYQIID